MRGEGQSLALRFARPPPCHRRARACPSPSFASSNARGGQSLALRFARPPPCHRRAWALACHTRMREGFPRHRSRARPCSSGSPDPEPFVIRRSQTTDGETHIVTMELAGDRPPRYGNIETRRSLLPNAWRGTDPRPTVFVANMHGEGQTLALR